jgi:uncharacterized protein YbgA (DUF1722 family)/uncharacterized protein YbbK (DUF523 family)
LEDKIKLGISSCLLGEKVRYDGGHKQDSFIKETLGKFIDFHPVCPEVECGLSIPREAMRLVGDQTNYRLVTIRTNQDLTAQMANWAERRIKELRDENLCGFIFKSKSPSSGMERIKVYNEKGVPAKVGVGIFAGLFMKANPELPIEDEGRLHDPALRENFIERIFTLKRWRDYTRAGISVAGLIDFHTRHKLIIMAHSQQLLRELGGIVAKVKNLWLEQSHETYFSILTDALKLRSTVKKQTNVLMHMMGYFKQQLSTMEKQELLEVIARYHQGLVPLVVPLTLLNHYVRKYEQSYLQSQVYLDPHPAELMLRNHV